MKRGSKYKAIDMNWNTFAMILSILRSYQMLSAWQKSGNNLCTTCIHLQYNNRFKYQMKLIKNTKIIDLSRIIVGPYATMLLADFGCEVIKIEPPEGDPTRTWGPPWHEGQSTYFMSINRNKKSLVLNLKEEKCRSVLYKMVESADAVIQNFVPGVTQKLKIDYESLKKHNDKLVYCSISGFGDFGTKKNYPAFDNIIQAQTGFMHLTGDKQTEPYKLGFAIADVVTSLYASNAILAGLIYKQNSGQGIHLKTSLYECGVSALINQGSNYLNGGTNPSRMGNHHPNIVPYGLYQTKTLPIIICVGTAHHYDRLRNLLLLDNLSSYASNEQRVLHREQFDRMLNDKLSKYTQQEIIPMMEQNGVPCGRVNDLQGLFEGKTVKQLGLVVEVEGKKFVRNPIRTNRQTQVDIRLPPSLNQEGRQILAQLGLSQLQMNEIQFLNKKGVSPK